MVIPYAQLSNGQFIIYIEERDFASVQRKNGFSSLITIPGFRLDKMTTTIAQMIGECIERTYVEFGLTLKTSPELLGGKYHPSIGFSPETAYLLGAEVDLKTKRPENARTQLTAVALQDALTHQHLLQDAHLLTALFRLSHALGVLK